MIALDLETFFFVRACVRACVRVSVYVHARVCVCARNFKLQKCPWLTVNREPKQPKACSA